MDRDDQTWGRMVARMLLPSPAPYIGQLFHDTTRRILMGRTLDRLREQLQQREAQVRELKKALDQDYADALNLWTNHVAVDIPVMSPAADLIKGIRERAIARQALTNEGS